MDVKKWWMKTRCHGKVSGVKRLGHIQSEKKLDQIERMVQ